MAILKPGYLRWTGTIYTTDPSIEIVGPQGPQGLQGPQGQTGTSGSSGVSAFTITTQSFIQPVASANVNITIQNASWIAGGELYVTGGGYYTFNSATGNIINVSNTGVSGNASPGTTIVSGSAVSPSGIQGPAGSTTGATGTFSCPGTVSLLNAVYVTGAGDTINQATANVINQSVIGIVISKPTTITAVVQYSGELIGFSSLNPGSAYYLSDITAGGITSTAPTTTGHVVQALGFAKDNSTLVLAINRPIIL